MTKMLIIDTADVVATNKRTGKKIISGETQLADLAASLGVDEKIFASIGNRAIAKFQGQKELTSTIRNALFDTEMLAMTQGVEVQQGNTALVYEKEEGLLVSNGEVSITGEPADVIELRNINGDIVTVDAEAGSVAVPDDFAKDGDYIQAWYKKEVTGELISFKSDKFGEAWSVEYRTIGYNPTDNTVLADVYVQLDHCIPSGEASLSFENGTGQTPEITLDALTNPNTNDIGRVLVIPRKNGEQQAPPTTP